MLTAGTRPVHHLYRLLESFVRIRARYGYNEFRGWTDELRSTLAGWPHRDRYQQVGPARHEHHPAITPHSTKLMAVRRSYVCKMPDISTRHFEVASLRGSWCDKAAFWLAMKSGDNAASHSHLDIGTFVLEAGGRRFAIDLGPDDYALPGYFSPDRRPGYYRISTAGHNTLLVDEANQPATARAQLIDLRSGPTFAYAVADLGPSYPALRTVRRGAALIDRSVAAIADEIEGAVGASAGRCTRSLTSAASQAVAKYPHHVSMAAQSWNSINLVQRPRPSLCASCLPVDK